jgi:two-component system, cell cycle sensor histidine kinase and response regulator CckA
MTDPFKPGENDERYRSIFENLDYIVFILDPAGIISYISPAVEQASGYTPSELIGVPFAGFVHPEDLPGLAASFEKTCAGKMEPYEFRVFGKNGSIRWVRSSSRPRFSEGRLIELGGIMSDITARRQAQEALRNSEALLQSVIDTSSALISVKARDGKYLLVNRRLQEVLGRGREEIIGRTDEDLFALQYAAAFRILDQKVLATGTSLQEEELVPHGELTHTYISMKACLRDDNGSPYAICSISTDITAWKQLEEQLRIAQKMEAVGRLAGGIAHDFNNLLTIVTGQSGLLCSALANDLPLREKASEIQRAAAKASSLTRQLLAFSRGQVLQPAVLSLNEIIAEMATMLQRLLGESIELVISTDAAAGLIRCDRGQIEQVIMNFVVNARDAMPDGGRLMLAVNNVDLLHRETSESNMRELHYVLLTVRDTGQGMDADTRAHIFEPFFTTKRTGEGTGLGLATVYRIIEQAGGRVNVESELGRGSTFFVYLPRVEGAVTQTRPRAADVLAGGSETILLVEDQEGVRNLISEVLRKNGYSVLPAGSGAEALRLMQERCGQIDLVLTDVVMPQMGGRQLVALIAGQYPGTKVLMMSGYAEEFAITEKITGVDVYFLDKPFTPEALLSTVRNVLDAPRAGVRSQWAG